MGALFASMVLVAALSFALINTLEPVFSRFFMRASAAAVSTDKVLGVIAGCGVLLLALSAVCCGGAQWLWIGEGWSTFFMSSMFGTFVVGFHEYRQHSR